MSVSYRSRLISAFQLVPQVASGLVIGIACLAMLGWGLGMDRLTSFVPGWPAMVPLIAIGFIFAGLSLWWQRKPGTTRTLRRLARAGAIIVGIIGLVTLTEYLFGWDAGIERWLIPPGATRENGIYPGRLSLNTALIFLLQSGALLLLDYETVRGRRPAQYLAFIGGLISWLALLGYAYGAEPFYAFISYLGIPLHAALALIALTMGVICARPDRGMMTVLISESAGGFMARRLLLAAVLVPSLLGWICRLGEWSGSYDTAFGTALLVAMNIIVFLIVIWRNAETLHYVDSERERAEAALRLSLNDLERRVENRTQELWESETLKKTVLDALPQHLAVLNQEGTILEVNEAWQHFAQAKGGAAPGLHTSVGANYLAVYRHIHGAESETAQQIIAGIEAVLSGTEPVFSLEYPCHSPAEKRWFLMTAVPLPRDKGGAVVVHTNITKRKLSEEALQVSNEMLRRLQTVTDTALSQLSLDNLLQQMLARVCETLDTDAAALWLLTEDGEFLTLRGAFGVEEEQEATLQVPVGQGITGRIAATRQPLLIDDLTTVEVFSPYLREKFRSLIGAPLLIEHHLIGVIHTETKAPRRFAVEDIRLLQLAADRIAVAIERAQLYESEQQARIRAEEASRMKDEFLAVVSHELRSPLNAILGWVTLLREGKLSHETTRRALEIIERSARAQNRLVSDLVDVSRIITGKLRLNVRPLELAGVIEAAIEALRPAAEAKAIHLQTVLEPAAGPVSGDADRLQQVVWNLVSNAIRFTPRGGRIQVRLERAKSHLEIIVSDTGSGIKPEFLPYVFDRFRQADSSSTRKTGGLGLGLSIVRHLVELHGGSVAVESLGEGQGATFIVKLPLLMRRATASSPARVPPVPEDRIHLGCPPQLKGLRVLVVDDDPDARELITTILTECAAEVKTAAASDIALKLLNDPSWPPDVLISDIEMPEIDGYSLIRQIRTQEKNGRWLPAIALTAYARAEDRLRALSAGFQMHVPKPVEAIELLTVVASLVGRLEQQEEASSYKAVEGNR